MTEVEALTETSVAIRGMDRLLREDAVCELLGVSLYTLQAWRKPGSTITGPVWVNVGSEARRAVRFRVSDVESWIAGLAGDTAPSGTNATEPSLITT